MLKYLKYSLCALLLLGSLTQQVHAKSPSNPRTVTVQEKCDFFVKQFTNAAFCGLQLPVNLTLFPCKVFGYGAGLLANIAMNASNFMAHKLCDYQLISQKNIEILSDETDHAVSFLMSWYRSPLLMLYSIALSNVIRTKDRLYNVSEKTYHEKRVLNHYPKSNMVTQVVGLITGIMLSTYALEKLGC